MENLKISLWSGLLFWGLLGINIPTPSMIMCFPYVKYGSQDDDVSCHQSHLARNVKSWFEEYHWISSTDRPKPQHNKTHVRNFEIGKSRFPSLKLLKQVADVLVFRWKLFTAVLKVNGGPTSSQINFVYKPSLSFFPSHIYTPNWPLHQGTYIFTINKVASRLSVNDKKSLIMYSYNLENWEKTIKVS